MSIQSLSDIDALFQKYRSLIQKKSETQTSTSPNANEILAPSQNLDQHINFSLFSSKDTLEFENRCDFKDAENEMVRKTNIKETSNNVNMDVIPYLNKPSVLIRLPLENDFILSTRKKSTYSSLLYTRRELRTEKIKQKPSYSVLEENHIDYFKPMKPLTDKKRFEPKLLGMGISPYLLSRSLDYDRDTLESSLSKPSSAKMLDTDILDVAKLTPQPILKNKLQLMRKAKHSLKKHCTSATLNFYFKPLELSLPISLSHQLLLEFFKRFSRQSYRPPNPDQFNFSFLLPRSTDAPTHACNEELNPKGKELSLVPVNHTPLSITPVPLLKERPVSPLYLSFCPSRFIIHEPKFDAPMFTSTDSLNESQVSLQAQESDNESVLNFNDFITSEETSLEDVALLTKNSDTSSFFSEHLDPSLIKHKPSEGGRLSLKDLKEPVSPDACQSHTCIPPTLPNYQYASKTLAPPKSNTLDVQQKSPITSQTHSLTLPIPSPSSFSSVEQSSKLSSSSIHQTGASRVSSIGSLLRKHNLTPQFSPTPSNAKLKASSSFSTLGMGDPLEVTEGSMNYNTIIDNSEDEYTDGLGISLETIYKQVFAWPGHFEINPSSKLDFDQFHDLNIQPPSIHKIEWILLSDPSLPNADTAMDIVEILQKNMGSSSKLVLLFWLAKSGNLDDSFVRLNVEDPNTFTLPMLFLSAQIRILSNRCEDALKDLEEILNHDRSQLIVWSLKARLHYLLGPPKSAINSYTQVIRARPKLWRFYYERGCEFESVNEALYAFEDFKMVRHLNADFLDPVWRHIYYYFDKHLYEDAQVTIQYILDKQPNNPQALFFRGKAHAQLQNFPKAMEDFCNAIRLDPFSPEYYIHRGCLLRESHPQKAIEDLSVALLLNDSVDTVDALIFRGSIYQKAELYELTLSDWLRARELISSPHLNTSLGILCIKYLDDYVQAMRYLDAAIDQNPTLLRAYLTRAELYQTMYQDSFFFSRILISKEKRNTSGDYYLHKAKTEYSRAIKVFPSNYLLYLYRGRILLRLKKTKLAMIDFHSAFKLNSGIAQTFHQRALILSFQGRYLQLIEEFQRKKEQGEQFDSAVLVLVAKAKLRTQDYEGGLTILNDFHASQKYEPQLFLYRGICLLSLKRYKEAMDQLSNAISLSSNFPKAYYMRGLCKFAEGNKISGISDINTAIQQDPKMLEAYLTRAKYYQSIGSYEAGVEDCTIAIRLETIPIRGHLQRGMLRCCLLKFSPALKDFTKVLALDQDCQKAYFNRGVAYHHSGKVQSALRDYSIAMLLMDSETLSRHNRGLLYLQSGDLQNAVWDLTLSSSTQSVDIRLNEVIGKSLFKLGQLEKSIEVLTSIVTNFPENEIGYLSRAYVYSQSGHYEKAIKDNMRCIHVFPRCLDAYVSSGYVFLKLGKFKRAWDFFSMALTLDSTCSSALEGRVSLHLGRKNYFAALMDITEAVRFRPNHAPLLLNRGVVYQCMGDTTSALEDYKAAIALKPDYAMAYFNAANLYYLQRNWEKAKEFYDTALSIEPMDPQILINRALLAIKTKELNKAQDLLATASNLVVSDSEKAKLAFQQACLCEKLNDFQGAEKYLDSVVQTMPFNKDGWVKRAEIRGHLGNIKGALEDFSRALAIETQS